MDAKTSEAVEESTFSSCTRRLKLLTEEFVRGESTREAKSAERGRGEGSTRDGTTPKDSSRARGATGTGKLLGPYDAHHVVNIFFGTGHHGP